MKGFPPISFITGSSVSAHPADMKRGFYSLSGLIHDVMGKDIRSGDVFIFYKPLLCWHENPSHGVRVVCDLSNHPARENLPAARY